MVLVDLEILVLLLLAMLLVATVCRRKKNIRGSYTRPRRGIIASSCFQNREYEMRMCWLGIGSKALAEYILLLL